MAKWFYVVDGQEVGPLAPAGLKRLADSGRLKPHDEVHRADMVQWFQATHDKGLFSATQLVVWLATLAATSGAFLQKRITVCDIDLV